MCDGADRHQDSAHARGDFVFVSDYHGGAGARRWQDASTLTTNVSRADVVFSIDVTASMGPCATDIAKNLRTTIVPGVKTQVSDAAFGLLEFQDFGDRADLRRQR